MKRLFPTLLIVAVLIIGIGITASEPLFAQELHNDLQGSWRARVLRVLVDEVREVPGFNFNAPFQLLQVEIIEGVNKGKVIEVENDFHTYKVGNSFYLNYLVTIDGTEIYSVGEPDRRWVLLFFFGLFVVSILIFGLNKGIRSLLSLGGSFFIIVYFMLPMILSGWPPVAVIMFFAAIIMAFAMYTTHGWNRVTHSAFLGTAVTIACISVLAYIGVTVGKLSGFASDEALYLNLNSGGELNIAGLLLGAIIIGVLGILDDISITQAATVREFYAIAPHMSRREVYSRALTIGKEHVVSLVNTLALAYAGASLPLLLLFYSSEASIGFIMNREIFATEIIRTFVGSIGLIMAVPVTTLIAVVLLSGAKGLKDSHIGSHSHIHGKHIN